LQISPVPSAYARQVEAAIDEMGLPIHKREQFGYSTPVASEEHKKTVGKKDRYVAYVAKPVSQAAANSKSTLPESNVNPKETQAKRAACLEAARELAAKGRPLNWLHITSLARKRSGLVIAEQFLAPSKGNADLRPQIIEMFANRPKAQAQALAPTPQAIPTEMEAKAQEQDFEKRLAAARAEFAAEDETLRQQLEAKAQRIAELEAALAQVSQPQPQATPELCPQEYLSRLVDQCQATLRRIEREAAQLEADRASVCNQLAAAQTLLATLTGEPTQQSGQLIQLRKEVA
jgi:hypothetical protein